MSFRDPAEENEIGVVTAEEIELTSFKKDKTNGFLDVAFGKDSRRGRKLTHTNSLSRCKNAKTTLVRSQSDGNLDKKREVAPMTINKYVKMLSGSWKNLLNCKFRFC